MGTTMGSERALWQTVRRRLGPHGVFVRVENRVGIGTPDVVYCIDEQVGWLELKYAERWPPKSGLTLRHLTMAQLWWMRDWRRVGGRAWILLQVGKDYLFLPPEPVEKVTSMALFQRAELVCCGRLDEDKVLALLQRRPR